MSRIDDIFARLKRERRGALMPFFVAGHPTLEDSMQAVAATEAAGASIVEIGFPFSDPIADGPVIAAAMHEALRRGVTPRRIMEAVAGIRPNTALGLIAMVSESIVHRIGAPRFVGDASAAGFDGLIVPDVDLDAAAELSELAGEHDMAFALLIAPTTSEARIERLTAVCRGFVYVLARTGLTGEQTRLPEVAGRVAQVRQFTDLPLAVGFGISQPEHVKAVTDCADAAIVGSALVRRMADADDPVTAATGLVRQLAGALTAAP